MNHLGSFKDIHQRTGIEELDTLDIVAHDHYREIVDDIKNNPVFKKRNLDEEDIPNTKTVMVEPAVENQQISLFDEALCESKVKSYQDLNNENVVENLFAEYQKAFVKKVAPKKSESDSRQMGRPAVEEPKDKRVSMRVTEKDYQRIVAYAKKQKITVAELISRAVKAYIETAQ